MGWGNRSTVRGGAPSVPEGAVAFFFSFQVRLGRGNRSPVRGGAPSVPEGRLHSFFRSKFGWAGAIVRRCAKRTFRAQWAVAFFFSFQVRLGRGNRSTVRGGRTFRAQWAVAFFFPF